MLMCICLVLFVVGLQVEWMKRSSVVCRRDSLGVEFGGAESGVVNLVGVGLLLSEGI